MGLLIDDKFFLGSRGVFVLGRAVYYGPYRYRPFTVAVLADVKHSLPLNVVSWYKQLRVQISWWRDAYKPWKVNWPDHACLSEWIQFFQRKSVHSGVRYRISFEDLMQYCPNMASRDGANDWFIAPSLFKSWVTHFWPEASLIRYHRAHKNGHKSTISPPDVLTRSSIKDLWTVKNLERNQSISSIAPPSREKSYDGWWS